MALAFESSMSDFLLFDDERQGVQQPSTSAAQPSTSSSTSASFLQSPTAQHQQLQHHNHEDSFVKQDLDFSSLLTSDFASAASQTFCTDEDFSKTTAPESMAYYAPYYSSDIPRGLSFDAPNVMVQPPSFYNPLQQQHGSNGFPIPSEPSSPSTSAEMFDFSTHSSVGSAPSVPSSDRGSPFSAAEEWPLNNVEDVNVSIYNGEYTSWPGLPQPWEQQAEVTKADGFVDPHLINSISRSHSRHTSVDLSGASPRIARRNTLRHSPYPPTATQLSRTSSIISSKGSPSGSYIEDVSFPEAFIGSTPMGRDHSMKTHRRTVSSASSPASTMSGSSTVMAPNASNRDSLCLDCNKVFRDLRAHQLTHLKERPEKCPIASCEYSKKGFARKYDCQRHTLTHYKGTMVCGFCPGSGLATEKTFNRADVFKRHLMSVHNVEQTPPNGRSKKTAPVPARASAQSIGNNTVARSSTSPTSSTFPSAFPKGADGRCSTCGVTFLNAQQFYEHLDDCVLHKVTEAEPAGAINEANLDSVKLEDIQATLAEHGLLEISNNEQECDDEDDEDDEEDKSSGRIAPRNKNATGRKGSGVAGR